MVTEAASRCFCRIQGIFDLPVPQDLHLALKIRVADGQPHQKAVQLGVGQKLGSRRAYMVFRGDDQKRRGQRMNLPVHRHLPLLHRLQQRRLGLAGGTVDLVSQEQIGAVDDAGHIAEAPALLIVHGKAHNIRGQHIRRELDAVILHPQHPSQGDGQSGLSHTGHVVQ